MPPLTFGERWRRVLEDPDAAAAAFPSLAGAMGQPQQRRSILKLMAASIALAGCDPAVEDSQWVPAVVTPPGIVPGVPNRYATATLVGGAALGIVVTHQMGRPIKVEGNPLHPASLGATDAIAQAEVLNFWDPDRAGGLLRRGEPSDPGALLAALLPVRTRLLATQGAGLRVLTGPVLSPTLGRALDGVRARLPQAVWQQWEPDPRDAVRQGARLAYGRVLDVVPHVERADVVLALESDLISGAPGWVRHARDLASRRNPARLPASGATMSRIYAVETVPSLIGSQADHRFGTTPAEMQRVLLGLRAGLLGGDPVADAPAWLAAVLDDLRAAPGRALIHAGPHLPAEAHALVHAMNERLGGRGHTYDLLEPAEHAPQADQQAGMQALIADMRAGRVETLLILDQNPVHTAPGFAEALSRVPLSLHAGIMPDETASAATWHLPLTHGFEAWSDLRAHDGTVSIVQPQALPLHGGRSALTLLSALLDGTPTDDLAAVRTTWRAHLDSDAAWAGALAEGMVPGTASPPAMATLRPEAARLTPSAPPDQGLTLLFREDPYLLDGRHANNAWLQELPRPLTKLTWENPVLVSPAQGLRDGDIVRVTRGGVAAELPVCLLPGLPRDCAVATLGYGRRAAGQIGASTGWNLYPLQAVDGAPAINPTGRRVPLPVTDRSGGHGDHAEILRQGPLAAFQANPGFLGSEAPEDSLYRVRPAGKVAWGMSVDLNACIGCNACVAACTAENNVPVVGRENVLAQREMHWLRIDRYWDGDAAGFQPMLCMHCEEAPCETVCPVEASVHDEEGLNLQVYNRCVGTRFCSNNCPYKVRRFNFGPYAQQEKRPPISRNPDVSVRARGVMEKCTFCVQRIAEARIEHDRDGVPEQAVTACQAACPTQAFTFGDLADPASAVVARKHSPLDYVLLPEQQTHPRLTYEARIRNPNPAIPA